MTTFLTLIVATLALGGFVLILRSVRRRGGKRVRVAGSEVDDPGADRPSQDRVELAGDIRLTGSIAFPQGLHVRGGLTLADGARVTGEVTADGNVKLDGGSEIAGPVTVHGDLHLGRGARTGPSTVSGEAVLAADARVAGRLVCDRLVIAGGRQPDAKPAAAEQAFESLSPSGPPQGKGGNARREALKQLRAKETP